MDRVPAKRILCSCATLRSNFLVVHFRRYRRAEGVDKLEFASDFHEMFGGDINDPSDVIITRAYASVNSTLGGDIPVPNDYYEKLKKVAINNWPARPQTFGLMLKKYGYVRVEYKETCFCVC